MEDRRSIAVRPNSFIITGTVSAALRAAGLPRFLPSVELRGCAVLPGLDLTFGKPQIEALSLGSQWRVAEKWQLAGEFYTLPGLIYTARFRGGFIF